MRLENIKTNLEKIFTKEQTEVLAKVIYDSYNEVVKVSDFNELKRIVKELAEEQRRLAEAQRKTEETVKELAEEQRRLAEEQRRLAEEQRRLAEEQRRLTEAQRKTEETVKELAEEQKKLAEAQRSLAEEQRKLAEAQRRTEEEIRELTKSLKLTRQDLGGLSRSVSYSLENEAYRLLPKYLKENYDIDIKQRMLREEIRGKEINLFAKASKDNKEYLLVGEVKLRIDDEEVFSELEDKVNLIKQEYKDENVIKILVGHFATKRMQDIAKERGVIIVQSFEW